MNQLANLLAGGLHDELEIQARRLVDRYPDFGLLWNVLGAALRAQGKDSLSVFDKAAKLAPDFAEIHCNLGDALQAAGRFVEAAASYRRALKITPDAAEVQLNLGNALQAAGHIDDAVASFRRALAIRPEFAEAHSNLGNALQASGQFHAAAASCRQALMIKPDFAEAHSNLGDALQASGKLDCAVSSYRRALAINPEFAEAHNNLGHALQGLGQLENAMASCRRALELKPDFAAAHSNLGDALQAFGQLDAAKSSYRRALAIEPALAEAHNNLGNALHAAGHLDEAMASCRRALELKPDFAEAYSNLGNALQAFGDIDAAEASYRRALQCRPDFADAHSNLLFALNYDADRSDEEILALCGEYDEKFGAPCRPNWQPHRNSREPGRRLRIGYVSPDFRRHALAYLAAPIFASHDRGEVDIYCYAEIKREDDVTERFRGMADHWRSTVGMSDDAVAELVREDRIDILVDLAGHSAGNRLRVFARKPAPIQVSYLGYPATTGLSAIDYRITDGHADPAGAADARYVERLVRLPETLWCFSPAPDMPEPTPLPALARGHLTYGSFNNFNKIDRPTVDLWAALLLDQPDARLMLLTVPEGKVRDQLVRRFGAHGVDPARLAFYGKLPLNEFHRRMLEADIALDPVNVNGGTTTCESLWLGVPVISLTGKRFLSRAGTSILTTLGMGEFACATTEQYLRTAAGLAGNLPLLANIRGALRARMRASPLTDQASYTRKLEAAYRQIWGHWCASGHNALGGTAP